MFDVKKDLAVQSYCYRHFKTIDALIGQIKALGVAKTELCVVHTDFNNEAGFEAAIGAFKKARIGIPSIGVQSFKGDAATEEKWCRFCKAAGAKVITASFDVAAVPGAYRVAEQLAEKYDLLIAIHNHGGGDWLGNATMLGHVFANTTERIGLCIDSAWCLQSGGDPVKWAEKFNSRLYAVHIKDFIFERSGKVDDAIVGTGNLKLKEFMALTLKAPKMASVTLEYEGDVENPNPKLKESLVKIAAAV